MKEGVEELSARYQYSAYLRERRKLKWVVKEDPKGDYKKKVKRGSIIYTDRFRS